MRRWVFVALIGAGIGLAGCDIAGPGRIEFGGVPNISCGGLTGGACEEQGRLVAARHLGATDVALDCTAAVCDRKGGSGKAVITLEDGSKVADTFAYTGDPAPLPAPECTGVAPVQCQGIATGQADDVPPSQRIVRIVVRCTAASCTQEAGETDVTITLGDGSVRSVGVGWQALE